MRIAIFPSESMVEPIWCCGGLGEHVRAVAVHPASGGANCAAKP